MFSIGTSNRPIKLLVSARDPAAAFHMSAICREASKDPRFQLTLVAQSPALEILQQSGMAVRALPALTARAGSKAQAHGLLALADAVLSECRPDVLLCGLSSPGEAGIDEALMARRNVPALLVQDFWGEQNNYFDAPPDLALVLDQAAAHLTQQRHQTATQITGSPRHSEYKHFDSDSVRHSVRRAMGIDSTLPGIVLGLFGQPLHRMDGYQRTLRAWAHAVHHLPGHKTVIYRPHPRETIQERKWTQDWLVQAGLPALTLDAISTEAALSVCDTACSVLSNCAYDAAYLNYFSRKPLVVPLLLLFDAELQDFYSKSTDFHHLPYIDQGLAHAVWQYHSLDSALELATRETSRMKIWQTARTVLPDPSQALNKVLDAIFSIESASSSIG